MRKLLLKFPKITGPLRSFYNMYFGEKEIKAILKLLRENKNQYIFFDIGANYGVYTLFYFLKILYLLMSLSQLKNVLNILEEATDIKIFL